MNKTLSRFCGFLGRIGKGRGGVFVPLPLPSSLGDAVLAAGDCIPVPGAGDAVLGVDTPGAGEWRGDCRGELTGDEPNNSSSSVLTFFPLRSLFTRSSLGRFGLEPEPEPNFVKSEIALRTLDLGSK